MAKTTRVAAKRGAASEPDDAPNGGDGGDDIDALLETLTGEAEHVVLWRVDGPKGKQEHVDKVALSRFNAEYVTERHGGGDYLFRVYGPVKQGGGRNVLKYKEFSIDKSIPPKSGSALLEWQKQNGVRPTATTTAVAAPVEDKSNAWAMVLAATLPAAVSGLFAVLSKDKGMDPVLGVVLQKIMSSDTKSGIDPVELQRLIADERERAYNHGRESAPREGSDDGTARVLESTLPGLVDIFKESVANDRAKVQAMRGTRTPAATPAAATSGGPQWLTMLRQYIPQLVGAMAAIEPAALAARVLDNLPVKVARELAASCEVDSFVPDTLAELPELSKTPERRAYFTALLSAVQDELAPAGQGEGEEGEEAGNGQAGGTAAGSDNA